MWLDVKCSVFLCKRLRVQPTILTLWTPSCRLLSFLLVLQELLSGEELLFNTTLMGSQASFSFPPLTRRAGGGERWKYFDSSWQDQLDLRSFSESQRPGWRSSCCCSKQLALKCCDTLQLGIVGVGIRLCSSKIGKSFCVFLCFVVAHAFTGV